MSLHVSGCPERSATAQRASPDQRFSPPLSSGCAHWPVAAGDLPGCGQHVSRLGCGEGLGGHRAFYPTAPRCNERQHAHGFGIRHVRDHDEIVLTKREVERDQLPAHLLTEPRNGGVPVLRLCQSPLDVLAREATLRDEKWHDDPPVFLRWFRPFGLLRW